MLQTIPPDAHIPWLTDGLRNFFDAEIENYATAVRQGDIRPWEDGYLPTLEAALDSWYQAPEDVLCGWLGIEWEGEDEVNSGWKAADELMNLAQLICAFGGSCLLNTLLDFKPSEED